MSKNIRKTNSDANNSINAQYLNVAICFFPSLLLFISALFLFPKFLTHSIAGTKTNNAGPPLPRKIYLISQPDKDVYRSYAIQGIRRAAAALGYHGEIEVMMNR